MNPSSQQVQKIVIIEAADMNSLSTQVLETLCKTDFVLTSDEVNLSKFLTSLRKKILLTNSHTEAKSACYMVIPKDDFSRLNAIFSSSFEENLAQMTKITENAQEAKMNGHLFNLARIEAKGQSMSQVYHKIIRDIKSDSPSFNLWDSAAQAFDKYSDNDHP